MPQPSASLSYSQRERLAGTRFADVRWVARTGSTNADLLEVARGGGAEGTVLVADEQTAGRGRRDRVWSAPPGSSLLVSVLLRPPGAVAPLVTAALACAAADAVATVADVDAGVKWPNDLVVPGADVGDPDGADRKLAGILAEVEWPVAAQTAAGWKAPSPRERVAVVAGIGLNVNWPAELPADLAGRAVALNHLAGADVDRAELLVELLVGLDHRYRSLVDNGPAMLLAEWRARCVTLDRVVRVDLGADDVIGTAVDLTDDGHLVVDTLEGDRRVLAVGDVVHVLR